MDTGTKVAAGLSAVVIGGMIGLAFASKAQASPQFTLSVDSASGNPLSSFNFSGALAGATTGTSVGVFDAAGKEWGSGLMDSNGAYAIQVTGFPAGTYTLHAQSMGINSNTVTIVVSAGGFGTLTIQPAFARILNEPDGSTIVLLGASAFGGEAPYTFTATWPDGGKQTSSGGTFQRTFPAGIVPLTSAIIEVQSSDGQSASVNVTAT